MTPALKRLREMGRARYSREYVRGMVVKRAGERTSPLTPEDIVHVSLVFAHHKRNLRNAR